MGIDFWNHQQMFSSIYKKLISRWDLCVAIKWLENGLFSNKPTKWYSLKSMCRSTMEFSHYQCARLKQSHYTVLLRYRICSTFFFKYIFDIAFDLWYSFISSALRCWRYCSCNTMCNILVDFKILKQSTSRGKCDVTLYSSRF